MFSFKGGQQIMSVFGIFDLLIEFGPLFSDGGQGIDSGIEFVHHFKGSFGVDGRDICGNIMFEIQGP